MTVFLPCFGALALEIASPPQHDTLDRRTAEDLGQHLAADLGRLLPGVQSLDLAFAAAHYDPTELLRPRWPLHAALAELAQRAPGAGRGRVIGFGAHAGAMPAAALRPDPVLRGGPLRLLPFAVLGDAAAVDAVGRAMEARLLETGMAGAATALFLQDGFGGRLEHARYLSLHDLCAMTAMQYEHAGIQALWPLIEAALLAPASEEWLDAPPEPLLRYADGAVRIAQLGFESWHEAGFAPAKSAAEQLPRAYAAYEARIRQLSAVLDVHAIPSRRVEVTRGVDPRAALR